MEIKHVVVLMLENRSFDNLFGFLEHPDARIDQVPAGAYNETLNLEPVPAVQGTRASAVDPGHHADAVERQLGPMGSVAENGGFVADYEERHGNEHARLVMQSLDTEVVAPALHRLALEFGLCDRWFSSVPGATWPNRHFAHAATSGGTVDIEPGFYSDPTIFELLERHGAAWRIYHDGPPEIWAFRKLWRAPTFIDWVLRRPGWRIANWFDYRSFAEHVADGDLPEYSFIEPAHNQYLSPPGFPRRTNSQHPHNNVDDDDDFREGDRLVAEVYETLRESNLFESTLLVITYDEHGGLYDHVVPPKATPPGASLVSRSRRLIRWVRNLRSPLPKVTFRFDRYGLRVPTILVSPWIDPGKLVRDELDHASIPATLRALFAPDAKPLTKRDGAAGTFHRVVTGTGRRSARTNDPTDPARLPDLSSHTHHRDLPATRAAGPVTTTEPDDDELRLLELADLVDAALTRDQARRPWRTAPPATRGADRGRGRTTALSRFEARAAASRHT